MPDDLITCRHFQIKFWIKFYKVLGLHLHFLGYLSLIKLLVEHIAVDCKAPERNWPGQKQVFVKMFPPMLDLNPHMLVTTRIVIPLKSQEPPF